MPNQRGGEVLRDTCALTLGDEPLAGGVEHCAMKLPVCSSEVTGDTIGVLLIGIPVSSMSGNDLEGQIGASKGAAQALELEISRKSC
jgi:hypothetical protein